MEEFQKRLEDYLESKIPEVPKSTRYEIAAFLTYSFSVHEADALNRNNREWTKMLRNQHIDRMRRDNLNLAASAWPKGESDE